jgi:hypothetical protein
LASACALALWLEPSLGQIARYLGVWGGLLCTAVAGAGIATSLTWLRRKAMDSAPDLAWLSLILIAGTGAVLFLVLFPIATSGVFGGGSDRADALNVALRALVHGRPPYETLTFRGNPPRPLPGALFLALPFYLLGTAAFQNLAWLALFAAASPSMIGSRRGAAIYLLVFFLFCPGALQEFVTGGDYLINAIYVAISVHLLLRVRPEWPRPYRFLAYLFFALCLSSRSIYVVEVPIVAAFIAQRRGVPGLWEFVIATGAALLAINLPFLLTDPARYPLLFSTTKLKFYPAGLHPMFLIPAISLGIACSAWIVRVTPRRVFLISALAFTPMFLPGLLFLLATWGPAPEVLASANYSLPLTIFGGLCLISLFSDSKASEDVHVQ